MEAVGRWSRCPSSAPAARVNPKAVRLKRTAISHAPPDLLLHPRLISLLLLLLAQLLHSHQGVVVELVLGTGMQTRRTRGTGSQPRESKQPGIAGDGGRTPGGPLSPDSPRDAWKGPQRRPQRPVGRRLEEVVKAVGGGYCRLQMPLRPALAISETGAGHGLGALEGGGGPPPLPLHPWTALSPFSSGRLYEKAPEVQPQRPRAHSQSPNAEPLNTAFLGSARGRDPEETHRMPSGCTSTTLDAGACRMPWMTPYHPPGPPAKAQHRGQSAAVRTRTACGAAGRTAASGVTSMPRGIARPHSIPQRGGRGDFLG